MSKINISTTKYVFHNLKKYLKESKKLLFLAIIMATLTTTFTIFGPKILGEATTTIAKGLVSKAQGGSGINFTRINNILILLIGMYLISGICNYIQNISMAKVSTKLSFELRRDIMDKINKLPLKYFDKTSRGDVLSRVTNDVDTLSQHLNSVLGQSISTVIGLIGIAIMMLSISWFLTLVSLIVIPVSLIFGKIITKKSQKYFKAQQNVLGELNGHVEEIYGGQKDVKAFNGEEEALDQFKHLNQKLFNNTKRSQFLSALMYPLTFMLGNISYIIVCMLGGYIAVHDSVNIFGLTIGGLLISIGDIQALIQYVRSVNQQVSQIAQIMSMIQSTIAAGNRVFVFLSEEEESQVDKRLSESVLDRLQGNVEFDNVCFGYDENNYVIENFNLKVKAGENIAIVGPTGAGKTTIVKLLMRFYDVNEGSIKIDGFDVDKMNRHDVRSICAMVLQDAWLFSGTIEDNLRYANENASEEDLIEACKMASMHNHIMSLDKKYQSEVNEETTNLSSGQRQLLTIARAFLADPKILILDEATSNVDTRTEVLIQNAMDELMKNRTSFVIAHRLSTIKNADKIIVLNKGAIVEIGNHEELLAKNGFYSELYNSQFAGCE